MCQKLWFPKSAEGLASLQLSLRHIAPGTTVAELTSVFLGCHLSSLLVVPRYWSHWAHLFAFVPQHGALPGLPSAVPRNASSVPKPLAPYPHIVHPPLWAVSPVPPPHPTRDGTSRLGWKNGTIGRNVRGYNVSRYSHVSWITIKTLGLKGPNIHFIHSLTFTSMHKYTHVYPQITLHRSHSRSSTSGSRVNRMRPTVTASNPFPSI